LEHTSGNATPTDYIKLPKREYDLLKEMYRTVKRQALLVRVDEAERNLASGKTKELSVDEVINSVLPA
jgi:hypothetical protein